MSIKKVQPDSQSVNEIQETMLGIGRKFAQKVEVDELTNPKATQRNFEMMIKSFRMVLQIEKDRKVFVNLICEFASIITEKLPRSKVYQYYLDFCTAVESEPLSRNQMYKQLERIGFKVVRKTDNYYLVPPIEQIQGDSRHPIDLAGIKQVVADKVETITKK